MDTRQLFEGEVVRVLSRFEPSLGENARKVFRSLLSIEPNDAELDLLAEEFKIGVDVHEQLCDAYEKISRTKQRQDKATVQDILNNNELAWPVVAGWLKCHNYELVSSKDPLGDAFLLLRAAVHAEGNVKELDEKFSTAFAG